MNEIIKQIKDESDAFLGIGNKIYELSKKLFPLNRSITGNGVRQTLDVIREILPELKVYEVPTGTKVNDWVIPNEWNVKEAWIMTPDGQKIADFSVNNLHLMGYSTPVDMKLSLIELQAHLHSLPNQPNAIPYVTSYYQENWGFCIEHNQRSLLKAGTYHVYIDSTLKKGSLTYGELIIPGATKKEIFISTYICHPSMANNEISGPCVTTYIAKWLTDKTNIKHTIRIIFIPETIGAISYLSKNIDDLKRYVVAGFNVTCIGDDRNYSYLPSRNGNTISDRAAVHVLKHIDPAFKHYSFLERGSDERQYCAPGVDLPMASIMRTKYGEYPEYHTSLDDLTVISASGLEGGFQALRRAIEAIDHNLVPKTTVLCEPQMGRRGLRPTLSTKESFSSIHRDLMNLWVYSDGTRSLIDIAELINVPIWILMPMYLRLKDFDILKEV